MQVHTCPNRTLGKKVHIFVLFSEVASEVRKEKQRFAQRMSKKIGSPVMGHESGKRILEGAEKGSCQNIWEGCRSGEGCPHSVSWPQGTPIVSCLFQAEVRNCFSLRQEGHV